MAALFFKINTFNMFDHPFELNFNRQIKKEIYVFVNVIIFFLQYGTYCFILYFRDVHKNFLTGFTRHFNIEKLVLTNTYRM